MKKEKPLCNNCTKSILNTFCAIETDETKKYYSVQHNREVLNNDGTCNHYDAKSISTKIQDYIMKKVYFVKNKITSVIDFFKYKIILKVKYGFDIRDTWGLGDAVAHFTVPRLKYLINTLNNNGYGTPTLLLDKTFIANNNLEKYYNFEITDNVNVYNDEDVDKYFKIWLTILDKILYSLELMDSDDIYYEAINNENYEDYYEGLRLFGIFLPTLFD